MSEKPKEENPNKIDVEVKVNRNEEIEELKKRLEDEKKAREAKEKELQELAEKKKEIEEDKADLTAKMETYAQQEFARKKSALIEKVKSVFPEKVAEIEAEIKVPEDLKRVEFMIGHLDGLRQQHAEETKKLQEAAKAKETETEEAKKTAQELQKKLEGAGAPSGIAPPNPSIGGEIPKKGYENFQVMMKDLRAREAAGDTDAKAIIDEFYRKWIDLVKKNYRHLELPQSGETLKKQLEK